MAMVGQAMMVTVMPVSLVHRSVPAARAVPPVVMARPITQEVSVAVVEVFFSPVLAEQLLQRVFYMVQVSVAEAFFSAVLVRLQ